MATEIINTIPEKFQPIHTRHFVLSIKGIDSFLVKSFHIMPIAPNNKNGKFFVVLHTCIAPSTYLQVEELKNPSWKERILRWYHGDNKAMLKILDPVGAVISQHVMHGLKLESVDYGTFTYDPSKEDTGKGYHTFSYGNSQRKVPGHGELKDIVVEFSFKKYQIEY